MSLKGLLSHRRKLAFRLTLWYAGIFTLSSCVAFLLFYMLITAVIRDRTDQELLDQAEAFSTILTRSGLDAAANFAVLEAQAAGVKKVFFRLLYPSGQVFSSSNLSYWRDIRVREGAIQELLQGRRPVFETVTLPRHQDKVRVLYTTIGPAVILQLGRSLESSSRFIDAFKKIFVSTMVILIGLAAGAGWFMARRAVSGVEAVTRTAKDISGGTLNRRVPLEHESEEVDQLAMTFNQMLDRIQALVTEIKEMSDNIAHDLKSPITRIRGMAEVTLATGTSLGEFETMAASTVEECDRLLDMINTMLMISRTEAGVHKLDRQAIDLARLVRDAYELFAPMAEDKGLRFERETPEACPLVGDHRLLQRMLSNLLDNAIKYTPPGGTVRISVSEKDREEIAVGVSDTGIGIPKNDLSRIFERFYRGDLSRSQPGIGLGLSLARAIARAHGGDISVTSTPNQGSTFTVILPKDARREGQGARSVSFLKT